MNQQQINNLVSQAEEFEIKARVLRENAGLAKLSNIKKGNIEEWLDVQFESSSGLTDEFALFARQYKKALVNKMQRYTLVGWNRGHFYVSCFFRNNVTGKLVYISCSDVRYFSNDWYENLLIRSAEHTKDWSGGSNCFSSLNDLKDQADRLTA